MSDFEAMNLKSYEVELYMVKLLLNKKFDSSIAW